MSPLESTWTKLSGDIHRQVYHVNGWFLTFRQSQALDSEIIRTSGQCRCFNWCEFSVVYSFREQILWILRVICSMFRYSFSNKLFCWLHNPFSIKILCSSAGLASKWRGCRNLKRAWVSFSVKLVYCGNYCWNIFYTIVTSLQKECMRSSWII